MNSTNAQNLSSPSVAEHVASVFGFLLFLTLLAEKF
jgi:hypothetical protein